MLERPRSARAGLALAILFLPACAVYDDSLLTAPAGSGGLHGGSGGTSALPVHFDSAASTGQGGSASGARPPGDARTSDAPSEPALSYLDPPSDAGATDAPLHSVDASDGGQVPSMIDDMEDDNALILPKDGRTGYWYASNDGSSTQSPKMSTTFMMTAGGHGSSKYAVRTSGGAFTGWGALVGFDFDAVSGQTKKAWDASAYRGITFWAKAESTALNVFFSLPDADTDPAGNVCRYTDGSDKACFDHFGTSITIDTTWTAFSVDFDTLHQKGFGEQFPSLRKDGLVSCQWMAAPGATFDFWIDDVAFY
jgi:hypothetical protein